MLYLLLAAAIGYALYTRHAMRVYTDISQSSHPAQ